MPQNFIHKKFMFLSLVLYIHSQDMTCDNKEVANITEENKIEFNKTINYSLEYYKEQFKIIQNQSIKHYYFSRDSEQHSCNKSAQNIIIFNELKQSLIDLLVPLDNGEIRLKESQVSDFFGIRGDIAFAIRNIEKMTLVVKQINKYCKDYEHEQEQKMEELMKSFYEDRRNMYDSEKECKKNRTCH